MSAAATLHPRTKHLDAIVSRVGEKHRAAVQSAVLLATDDEIEALARDRRLRTLPDIQRAAEERRKARRRESTKPHVPYFQREIKRLVTEKDPLTGEDVVRAMALSCGHVVPTFRRVPATTRRTAAPCPSCGSGTRAPFEHRRAEERFDAAMERAYVPDRRRLWAVIAKGLIQTQGLSRLDRRRAKVEQEMSEALRELGLMGQDDGASDEESEVA